MEEADRVEGLRLKTGKKSLDLSMRPLIITFEVRVGGAMETKVSQIPEECLNGKEVGQSV